MNKAYVLSEYRPGSGNFKIMSEMQSVRDILYPFINKSFVNTLRHFDKYYLAKQHPLRGEQKKQEINPAFYRL